MDKSHIFKMADALTDEDLSILGVKERSVRLARERGMFPASWYPQVRVACDRAKIACPFAAFNFKSPSPVTTDEGSCLRITHGDTAAPDQVGQG